jgi:hypothetical protein
MIGLFSLVAVVLWYIVEWVKKVIDGEMDLRRIFILVLSVVGGAFLAFQYRLDVFVLAAEMMGIEGLQITTAGHVLAGIVLASGAAGVFELLKALRGLSSGEPLTDIAYTTESISLYTEEDADLIAKKVLERLESERQKPPDGGLN